jgi:hypothetical protein
MIKFLKLLLARRDQGTQGPQVANSVTVNEVLARRQTSPPAPEPALRAAKARGRRPQLPEKQQDTPREIDFGIDGITLAEPPSDTNFNPYESGRYSATELWEKRQRSGET